jgi:hypothetical protein
MIIPAFTLTNNTKPLPLKVTNRFLHFYLPLGSEKREARCRLALNVLVDTTGGINMGEYTEHKAYALSHPEVVYRFIEFVKDDHTPFAVKGIYPHRLEFLLR